MAATLKEAAPEGDNTWSEFALVARDLGGKKPLETIPLASRIRDVHPVTEDVVVLDNDVALVNANTELDAIVAR